jgi:4-hydroxybenzoate polyprenyltransferase
LSKLRALLKASHLGPTLIVTAISWFFAAHYWWEGLAYVIAFGVFTGQLVVGWSNDLYDYEDDLKHNCQNKPLVS